MFNQPQEHPVAIHLLWKKTVNFLFDPYPSITEVDARRQARFLSIIGFLFALTSAIGLLVVLIVVKSNMAGLILSGLTATSIIGYVLSRTRWNKIGGYAIVWALVLVAFVDSFSINLSNSLCSYLIPALILASIMFPFRHMVIFISLNNLLIVAMGVLTFVYPKYTNFGVDLAIFLPASVLTLVASRYRENVEHDRFNELKHDNQEMTRLSTELEQHAEDGTRKLRERSRQMQVVTEVARNAASFQDLDRLLNSSTRLISETFGYYHVGIFLLDEDGQYATLRAANSEGGQRLLDRMHKLPVDLSSIVGYTAKTHSPRIALDTGSDSVYFNNPDLPQTRSEMALPLKVGMRLIGILDVQSTEKDAFSEDNITILGTLADQLALALDNTRLLGESRRALVTAEQTYQRYFNQAWSQFSNRYYQDGYRYTNGKVFPLSQQDDGNQVEPSSNSKLSVPLIIRGQDIGTIDILATDEERVWTDDEKALLEVAAERAALALESARLLQDAQKRASKERIIGEISTKIGSSINLRNVLQTAVEELGHNIPGAEIVIELASRQDGTPGHISGEIN